MQAVVSGKGLWSMIKIKVNQGKSWQEIKHNKFYDKNLKKGYSFLMS